MKFLDIREEYSFSLCGERQVLFMLELCLLVNINFNVIIEVFYRKFLVIIFINKMGFQFLSKLRLYVLFFRNKLI